MAHLAAAFSDPPVDAARAFRQVLGAMSHPGRIFELSRMEVPSPCSSAAAAVLLTLVDGATPLHLAGPHDCEAMRDWVRFHLGAELVGPAEAVFALGSWEALGPLNRYALGSADYPDRSATLIVERSALLNSGTQLTGPGIRDKEWLNVPDPVALQANSALFPRGLDFLLTSGVNLAALPRSTQIGAA